MALVQGNIEAQTRAVMENMKAILAEAGSGIISVNGAAAHKASVGDKIIIAAYCGLDRAEMQGHKPRLVYVDDEYFKRAEDEAGIEFEPGAIGYHGYRVDWRGL